MTIWTKLIPVEATQIVVLGAGAVPTRPTQRFISQVSPNCQSIVTSRVMLGLDFSSGSVADMTRSTHEAKSVPLYMQGAADEVVAAHS